MKNRSGNNARSDFFSKRILKTESGERFYFKGERNECCGKKVGYTCCAVCAASRDVREFRKRIRSLQTNDRIRRVFSVSEISDIHGIGERRRYSRSGRIQAGQTTYERTAVEIAEKIVVAPFWRGRADYATDNRGLRRDKRRQRKLKGVWHI